MTELPSAPSRSAKLTAKQALDLYLSVRCEGADVDLLLQAHGLTRDDLKGIEETVEAAALRALAARARRGQRPRMAPEMLVFLIGAVTLLVVLLLGSALAISLTCGGPGSRPICRRVPPPVLAALVGPSATPTPTPTITPAPLPTLTPTPTFTPSPTPTPTPAASAPPADCNVGYWGEDDTWEVQAEEPVDFQPVVGDPYRFEAVWHLKPAGSKLCEDMEVFGYQLRASAGSSLPFQMEGHEFRLTELAEGLYEARAPFMVLDPRREAGGQEGFTLFYLTDPDNPERPESYREVPYLTLQLEWHLRLEVTPTPTRILRPTSVTPNPIGGSMPQPVLKSPNEGYSVQEWVTFEWDWGGSLVADLYFQVLVRRENNPKAEFHGGASPTKKKAIEVNFSELVGDASWNRWGADPDYQKIESGDHLWWSVVMVRWNGKAESPVVVLSETESALRKFVYAGESPVPTSTKPTGSTEEPSPCKCQRLDCRECSCDDPCCKQCCPKCW